MNDMTHSPTSQRALMQLASLARQLFPAEDPDTDNFDDAVLGEIPPGEIRERPHFRVQTDAHTTAAFAYENAALPALGRRLGIVKGDGATSLSLWFKRPRQSITFDLVAPPGLPDAVTVATLLKPGNVSLPALTVYHDRSGQRVRLGLSLTSGGSFDGLSLEMPIGTYIDDAEMLSPVDSSAEEVNFDELAIGPAPGLIVQPKYFIIVGEGAIKIAQASGGETSGHVLASDSEAGNDVSIIFATRRNTLDLTVVPDPDAPAESLVEFLSGGDFETLHKEPIAAGDGPRQLSYTERDPGKNIQGIRWTGGKLMLDHLILHSNN
jgi:hypothetical protein